MKKKKQLKENIKKEIPETLPSTSAFLFLNPDFSTFQMRVHRRAPQHSA
jgi:hypothetical protein